MHAVTCRTVTISQRAFSLPNNQIWRFSKAFGSENYRLALSAKKRVATVFPSLLKFRK